LTGVLSPDYVDLTNDGITDDDLGEAIKINYTQVYNPKHTFKWRTPFEKDSASYQAGLISKTDDDKANYIYGEKEVWYVHSIESKTMVAQFILQDRSDGFGVTDNNGGINTSDSLKCIKEIRLYSKADLIKNGASAVPIKVVHFVYNYKLCPNTPNSRASGTRGKLTLQSIYFTYGNNTEGALNSYQFKYGELNPSYSHSCYDRWGNYKQNSAGMPVNADFQYTLQDSALTGSFCSAWNLDTINLPSGGLIAVHYEPNDYAYVQNQRANQMFIIRGVGHDSIPSDSAGTELYSAAGVQNNDWLFVDLPTHVTSDQDFYNKYLAGIDAGGNKLYFRCMTNVGNWTAPHYEYVPGYADIAGYHRLNAHLGAIKLNEVNSGNAIVGNANPVAMASWQFLRLNLPEVAYPGSKVTGNILSIIEMLFAIIPDVIDVVTGFDARAVVQNFGRHIVPSYSYIRLDNPNYKKLGGGARVREIDISDSWSGMVSGQSTFNYGQTFKYTTTSEWGQVISSGVATYEPISGGDENPMRQPLPYDEKYLLAPNNHMYTETPLGESLYPSPGIVYSKVTVSNLQHHDVIRTATGYTVNEFYTAYDFPVINDWTDLRQERVKPSILSSIFNIGIEDYTTASQGFRVEVSDMPGKEKSQEVYDQNSNLISSVRYDYQVDNPSAPSLHLNNDVSVVNQNGVVSTASIGKDIDVWEDMREQDSQSMGMGANVNLDSFIIPFLFLSIPNIFPDYSSEHTRFRSSVTTKYIYRTGLVSKVTKMQNGSTVTTRNLLYDGETGEVLLTQTNNEFDKPVYNFTYPAHWAYDGMAGAYKNIGAVMNNVLTHSTGTFSTPNDATAKAFFAPGDELEISTATGLSPTKVWVADPKIRLANDSLVLMDNNGKNVNLNTATTIKIIRSGRRNMASTPIGTIVSLKNPITNDTIKVNQGISILQAGGSLFTDLWKIPYNSVTRPVCSTVNLRADTCLAQFMDSLITDRKFFATPSDSIWFWKYVHRGTCEADSAELYYALSGIGYYYDEITNFQAELGNSILTISSTNGAPVSLDSLVPYTLASKDSISSQGCLNLFQYIYHSKRILVGYHVIQGDTVRMYEDSTWYTETIRATACLERTTCHDTCVNLAVDSVFNPYAQGMLGNWRPERNYVYYDSRSPAFTSTKSDIWTNGTFNHFNQMWDVPSSSNTIWPLDTNDKNWTWTSRITQYDQKGNEVEDVDALGRYSSALYGYVKSLPVAVSSNAKFQEIAFDGFEDYGFNPTCSNSICDNDHFSFRNNLSGYADTTSTQAHTGKYSLMITAGYSDSVYRQIHYFSGKIDSVTETHFFLLNGGNIPLFAPDSGTYLLSAWVKESVGCGSTGYTKDSIQIKYNGSGVKYVLHPSGPLIEGWQRFEGKFKVPKAATGITVKLFAGNNTTYYDDIRIEPFAAEMKTYVYDPASLRLMATLDENNYATIYEYNDEGILMRVKKETERGIKTIKESRSSYKRQ